LLVRGGESDVLTPGIAREFTELAASATLAEVPRAGHMVAGDNNDAFTEAIRAWLDTIATHTSTSPRLRETPIASRRTRQ
jgi:pimeloyl-ACP methyl ester carboxylesterase